MIMLYMVHGKSNTSFLRKTPIKEIISTCEMFCRRRISRKNNSIQLSCKRKPKGSVNSSNSSKPNLRNLDIQNIFGRNRLIGKIYGAKDEVEDNTSAETCK